MTTVRQSLASVRENGSAILGERRAALHPEIAAAIAGFANSTRREDGLYAMVDIGGGTVDCCAFTLFADRTGQARCPILLAQVELLGVEPWRICEDDQGRRDDFRFLLDTLQNLVIWGTKQRLDPKQSPLDNGASSLLYRRRRPLVCARGERQGPRSLAQAVHPRQGGRSPRDAARAGYRTR
ncbi:hypothetical protein KO353_08075 [Elioraea tepida]|uniref:Uncharacterized protein n=1 Tax=Elioraea tepida TaxID=2843330 RepID=A0A975U5I2_9PROT|nr:hypothetical protein [Elioraea tepida]QXM26128.1 hypothetical protein KO353_08075 [Elioraea tepida]